ncbi:MAG TPA: hypothetical protein PKA82_14515 [Pyrinomonadaceae bacterium]|nr:hypothetical protein [Pyrinomonadaceae bacterium]
MGGVKYNEVVENESPSFLRRHLCLLLSLATAVVYFFSNPKPQNYYDYTFRVAGNLLKGKIAFNEPQPSWLNEFVSFEGFYYSVFPLGSVISMIPAALLKAVGIITDMPGAWISAILAGVVCYFCLKIAEKYDVTPARRVLMSLGVVFGTFMWTNLTFAGAWQLALGFAMVGELGAIYFTVYDRRPLLAGLFFAMAFGNRTEVLLTAPVFFYLLYRGIGDKEKGRQGDAEKRSPFAARLPVSLSPFLPVFFFCAVPFVLGVSTLVYNYVRFHSFTDFGYARIPGVLNEPWYHAGIFSTQYIPTQAWEMLFKLWNWKSKFPYLVPDGFSASILLSSPFLLFVFRVGAKNGALKLAAWLSVIILTIILWCHGNAGGWQFGYRYAMVLLPWIFVIMLENAPKKVTIPEWILYGVAFLANLYATWLFNWTEYMKVQ